MPCTLLACSHGERLLIRAIRLVALENRCYGIRTLFEHACGPAGPDAWRALDLFLWRVGREGRRRLALSMPFDPRLTTDERTLLDAFAHGQSEAYAGLIEILTGLLDQRPDPPMVALVCQVAHALEFGGLTLGATVDVALMAAE